MNLFLQRGQLQTIEPQKDRSVIEDMDTLVSEVSSDEFLDMVQQEGTSKDLNRAMDMVELQGLARNPPLGTLGAFSRGQYNYVARINRNQNQFSSKSQDDIMEDEVDCWLSHEEFGFEDDDLEGWNPHDEYENDFYDDF